MDKHTKQSLGAVAIVAAAMMATGCSSRAHSASSATSTTPTSPPTSATSSTLATSDWPTTAPGAPAPTSSPRPSSSTPPTTTRPATSKRPAKPPREAAMSPAQARVKAFVVAVVTTKGVSRSAWTTKVSAFVDPDLGRQLGLTDPVDIPVQKVTGNPQLLYTGTTEAVTGWFVPTSATGYTVTLAEGGGQLQIVAVTPGRTAPTTSVPTDND